MTLSRCTVCGLPITSKPEWDDIQFNNTYWASFKLIGDSILWSIPRGNSGAKGIQRFFKARERILKDTGLFNQPHVEIKDYSHTLGHATNAARQQFIECMKIERDRNWLKGYVGYNASLPVKLRINVGKRLYRLTFPLKLVNRYEDAVALAVNLVKTTGGNGVKNVRNRSWLLELEGYSAKFELIGDDILYNNAEGVLRAECVDPFFKFYEQVLSEAGLISKKPYFRIVNWKNLQRTAWSARKLYINRMTRLNKEISCRYSVLYGLNGFMKILVNSSRMFSPFKLAVADDFESAMAMIEKEKDQPNSSLSLHREPLRFAADEVVKIDHINQLLAFIGRLNWDTNGIEIEENERPISEEFLPLYQSISLIKQDFDGILQEKTSAQKQLKQSEKKYRTIIESINDGYYEVDLHGKITFCNHALSKLLGASKKKLPGMNFRQFANRKNYVKIVQYFKHFYETGKSESVLEWELEKKDGKKIFVDTSVSLIQDNESKPQGFRGMVRDITDRIQSENKILETSKDLENLNDELEVAIERSNKMVAESAMAYLELDQIFRASTEGIWVVSQSFDILRINKMLLSIIGKTQEEIKGKKCYKVFPNPLCHTNECPVCFIIESCEPRMERDFEICLCKDVIIPFIMSAFPFRDVENETIGVVIGLKDITERKNAEALHGEKIKAEAENIAKSEFLANISHEMRTPLNGVIGMAELIQKTKLDDNQKNIFDTIVNEARALIGIINNVLDFSKIEAGKFELENIGFELGYLIEDISKSIAVRAQQRKLELISYIAPDLPRWLLGDPGRLRQILMNLAGNALKFTRKGEILITAQKQKDLGETVAILFSIKDTGIGIPLDKQKSIFNSFTQVDGSITRKYGGTGLGTTISKQLVELMGGKIGFKSQEGKGSNFSFVLEFKKYKNLNIKQGVESVKLRSLRILIATGNKRIGDVQSRYLKTWGCHPFWVKTGEESLQSLQNAILEDRPFDIAIIDTLLAEMTGFELAEDIRKTNSIKSIPIVLMTSVGWIGDGKLCKYLNINGYLTKPVGMEDLKKTIKLALGLLKKEKTGKSTPLITRHTLAETQEKDIQILLAEDYPTNQQVVLGYLSDSGYKVALAENGLEAVNMYKAKTYDIVLMDIQMPVMGGFEATKLIREYEEISGKRTPIVAMTAHAMGGYKQLCLDTGMDDYISKPLLNKDFFAVLDKWTRGDDNYKKVKNDLSGETIPDNIRIKLSDQISDLPGVFKSESSDHIPMNYEKALLEFMGKKEILDNVIQVFLDSAREQIKTLRLALSDKDMALLQNQAHTIKGGAANLTANELSNLAFELEKMGKSGNLKGGSDILDKFENEFSRLESYVGGKIQ